MNRLKLNIYLFGSFKISINNKYVSNDVWRSKKSLNLFKYLVSRPGKKLSKDKIMDLLWPESGKDQSHNLHTIIYYIRNTLRSILNINNDEFIKSMQGMYWFDDKYCCWIDCIKFKNLYKEARQLEETKEPFSALQKYKEAILLYTDDFLADDLYTDWTREYRQYYREIYIDIILRASSIISTYNKDFNEAARLCQQGLEIDPYREELCQSLLSYLIEAGYYGKAGQKYREYSKMLAEEFGIYPGPRTQELFKKINIEKNRMMKGNDSYVFQCDKKTFDLIFNLNKRKQERTGEAFILILIEKKEKNDTVDNKVLDILNKILRKGDVICLWNGMILLQLFQAGEKASFAIKRRLKKYLCKDILNSLKIKYHIIKPENKFNLEDHVI